jgi:hypothetical protein
MTMAYEKDLKCRGFIADTDLSDYQYCAMKMNTDEEIILASDANDRALGVLQDAPSAAGRPCLVATGGVTKAKAGAAINAGAAVEVGAGGKFVTLTTGPIAGIAYTAAGDADELFSLEFFTGE